MHGNDRLKGTDSVPILTLSHLVHTATSAQMNYFANEMFAGLLMDA